MTQASQPAPAPCSFSAQMLQICASIEAREANRQADKQSLEFYVAVVTPNPKPTRSFYTRAAILQAIALNGPVSVSDLAERLGFNGATISQHCAVLSTAGLIIRTRRGGNLPDILEAA